MTYLSRERECCVRVNVAIDPTEAPGGLIPYQYLGKLKYIFDVSVLFDL